MNRSQLAALAYPLGFLGATVCLWRGRGDPFVTFHAWQSIFLSVACVVAMEVLDRTVPLLGLPLALAVGGATLATALFLAWRAWNGRWTALPLIGDVALERLPPDARP